MSTHPNHLLWFPMQAEAAQRIDILKRASRNGMKQRDIALALGVAENTVSNWLAESRVPRRQYWGRIDQLAREIGLSGTDEDMGIGARHASHDDTVANTPELRAALLDAMTDRDWSFGQLCRAAGYDSPNTIRRLLTTDELDFFASMLAALIKALELSLDALPLSDADRQLLLVYTPVAGRALLVRDIPIIGSAQAAELSVTNGVLTVPDWADAEKFPAPTDGRKYFAFRVEGQSMAPKLEDGEIVLADANAQPLPGKPAVVLTTDDELLIKLWRPLPDGTILLDSVNAETGAPRILKPDQIQWKARAVLHTGAL